MLQPLPRPVGTYMPLNQISVLEHVRRDALQPPLWMMSEAPSIHGTPSTPPTRDGGSRVSSSAGPAAAGWSAEGRDFGALAAGILPTASRRRSSSECLMVNIRTELQHLGLVAPPWLSDSSHGRSILDRSLYLTLLRDHRLLFVMGWDYKEVLVSPAVRDSRSMGSGVLTILNFSNKFCTNHIESTSF